MRHGGDGRHRVEAKSLLSQLLEPTERRQPTPGERLGFGAVPWGVLDVLVVTLLCLLVQVILTPIGYVGYARLASPTPDPAALRFFLSAITSYSLTLAIVWLLGVRRHRSSLAELGFRPLDLRGLVGFLAALAVTVVGANVVLGLVAHVPRSQSLLDIGSGTIDIVLIGALVVIAAPLAEETLFRGYLLQGLAHRMPFWPAAVITSAVFALAHVWWQLYVPIFVLGLAFAWLFWRTGSLWAPIAAHATINATSLAVALLALR